MSNKLIQRPINPAASQIVGIPLQCYARMTSHLKQQQIK